MASSHVLLFGDQLVEKAPAIRNLYHIAQTRPQVRRFLQEATDAAQSQLPLLLPSERAGFGHFKNLLDLAEYYSASAHPDETAGAVLITTAQVGELISIVEEDSSLFSSEKIYPLGFCVGLVAASVAAGAKDTNDLVRLGAEAVAISFRLGMELNRRARNIEDSQNTWGATLIGPEQQILKGLEQFNSTLPPLRACYEGVITSAWTTVFGPPSTIEALQAFEGMSDIPKQPLTAATSVHAPHLPPLDIEKIVGDSDIWEATPLQRTVYSSSTCQPFQAKNLNKLMHNVIVDITARPLYLEKTVKAIGKELTGSKASLTTVGPTPHTPTVQKILQQSKVEVKQGAGAKTAASSSTSRGGSGLIAIVGMSGRFPQSENLEEFWELLAAGTATHEEIPAERFDLSQFKDQNEKNAVLNKFGCFLKNPGDFDNRMFNVSPREAMQMDPMQRMMLMATYEALEQAGYATNGSNSTHDSRMGTYFGQTTEDWRTINDQQGTDTHYLTSSDRAFVPGRVAHHFKWSGPFYNIDSACSSSTASIHLAVNDLLDREVDTTVVGGGSLCIIPPLFSGLSKGGFLSLSEENGSCKTFQDTADGYCRGEAIGVVVMKRYEDAVAENDNILGVIRGTARNSNAGAGSITQPSEAAQEALFTEVLRKSNTHPNEVGFVEMHGTATQLGDKAEMNTVSKVFAKNRGKDNPLFVGAVKANVGHGEAAAGVVSLIKCLLMLRNEGHVPPQPQWPFTLNPNFPDLEKLNIKIADGQHNFQPWSKGDGKRKMLVNSFDAAGGNCTLLIEEGPRREEKEEDPRSTHVVAVSGRSQTALAANKTRLLEFLNANKDVPLENIAYTTTARRLHEVNREAFVVSSTEELYKKLAPSDMSAQPNKAGKVGFVFTGQGSPYTGMGKTLYETSPRFRELLDSYQAAADFQGQANFLEIIKGNMDSDKASAASLQMAIVALEIALAQYWQSVGLKPAFVMGHSLGEYAALCIAGVLSVTDALYLVFERASLIEKHCQPDSYAMLAVPQHARNVRQHLSSSRPSCEIACLNGPSATVVSGKVEELQVLAEDLKAQKANSTMLHVRYGFHSSQLDPVLEAYEKVAANVIFAKPQVPVASTLLGEIVNEKGTFGPSYLRRQMREPVNFVGAVWACESGKLIQEGTNIFEVGPHPVCLSLVAQSLESVQRMNSFGSLKRGQDDWKSISTALAGAHLNKLPVDWQQFHSDYKNCVRLVDLPRYAFDIKTYWHTYEKPSGVVYQQAAAAPAQAANGNLKMLGTSGLQYVESIVNKNGAITGTFQSKITEPNLYKAIKTHGVDGVCICPASVFGDMAYSAASYLMQEKGAPISAADLEIVDLDMTHALVVKQQDPNLVISVQAKIEEGSNTVSVSFSSSSNGPAKDHGSCQIKVHTSDASRKAEWNKIQKLVKGSAKALTEAGKNGSAHRMNNALVYKLFSAMVQYGEPYQTIQEAFISPDFSDAVATIKLGKTAGLGSWTASPYAMDATVQLAGFMLNGNIHKPEQDIHIANHIDSIQILEDLNTVERDCTCFATVRETTDKGVTFCDIYVYDDNKLLAIAAARFQKLSREIFGMMVGKQPATAAAPAPRAVKKAEVSDSDDSTEADDGFDTPDEDEDDTSVSDAEMFDLSGALLSAISSRTGVEVSEMEPSSGFADMGIDSPMAIAILADFKKSAGVELPAAFFTTFPTVAEAREELDGQAAPAPAPKPKKEKKKAATKKESKASKPAAAPKKEKKASGESHADILLRLTAAELGIDVPELESYEEFKGAGVDSMLSIKVLANFRKETGSELPAAFFNSFTTVAEVREELGSGAASEEEESLPESEPSPTPREEEKAPAPATEQKKETISAPEPAAPVEKPVRPQKAAEKPEPKRRPMDNIPRPTGRSLFSSEELDMTSSRTASPKRRPMDNIPRPTGRSLFSSEELDMTSSANARKSPSPEPAPRASTPAKQPAPEPTSDKPEAISRAVLIQGKSRNNENPLFLITDGSGAVSPYIHLPALPNGRKIYALESPFLDRPADYTIGIHGMAKCFANAIRKIQPKGPYMIGGWSAGSVYSYETCQRLIAEGEKIRSLIIIDMRVPHSVEGAPHMDMKFVESTGAFTGVNRSSNFLAGLSDKQKGHLTSTVNALLKYDPEPMPKDKVPEQVHVIWAAKGLNDSPNPEERDERITGPAAMVATGDKLKMSNMSMEDFEIELKSWFFAKRRDFGKNGWENYVGDNIDVTKVDGDHFSMVAPPIVKDLGKIILDAVARVAEKEKKEKA